MPPVSGRLVEQYRAGGAHADAPDGAEARLRELCDAAGARWPELDVDAAALARALGGLPAELEAITADTAAEVALAVACGAGSAPALAALEKGYLDVIVPALAHMKLGGARVDEVQQEVRRKLLVAEGDGPPRIVEYAGKGSLRGLIKVMAVRTAISALRKTKREVLVSRGRDEAGGDFETEYLKERYREPFREAFEAAIDALDHHEKNLLRMHFLGKVTLEQLAKMYGVHRATIVRRLAAVREQLAKATREGLGARLAIAPDELESVMNLVRSRMDLSVERMLRTRSDPDEPADGS